MTMGIAAVLFFIILLATATAVGSVLNKHEKKRMNR